MTKNGRHANFRGWTRPRAVRPDGYRPLSLVPPLPDLPETIRTSHPEQDDPSHVDQSNAGPMPSGAPASHDLAAAEPEFTAAQAEARARELAEWMANRERRLAGERTNPSGRWKTIQPPPPPDPRAAGFASPGTEESSPVMRDLIREMKQRFLDEQVERWGGQDALDHLDLAPLPDEPFDWSSVPTDHRVVVQQILALVDDTCDTWFDQEHRTACRRLLARVAGEPWVISRRGKVETIAGAIVWTIATFNRSIGRQRRRGFVPATWIAQHLGLSSGSAFATRSIDICIAAGIHLRGGGPEPIAEPTLIVSRRRRHVAALRDRYRDDLA